MKGNTTTKIALSAMLASLTCVATMIIQIPSPATSGYVNLGDAFVIVSAYLLGGIWGAGAAGLGSALADILSGYTAYAPATFVIKALMAIAFIVIFKALSKLNLIDALSSALAAICSELIMIFGYFAYEALILGYGAAALGAVPANIIQGAVGAFVGVLLVLLFSKNKALSHVFSVFRKNHNDSQKQ